MISKMFFVIKILTHDLTQIPVFLLPWPIAFTIIPTRTLNYVEPSGRGGALKFGATKTIIGFSIAPILLVVPAKSFRSLSTLKVMERQSMYFQKRKAKKIRTFITRILFNLRGRKTMSLKTTRIYFTDIEQKIEGGFGLRNNRLPDNLVLNILLTAVLLGLGMNKRL